VLPEFKPVGGEGDGVMERKEADAGAFFESERSTCPARHNINEDAFEGDF
jgi:hypothetical protein